MNLIVAVDTEWGIGYRGDLLARIRGDLAHFASLTTGKVVVLGSNTLATFPGGRVLKNRINIVLHPSAEYAPEGATVVHSLAELFAELKKYDSAEVFVIGGASVYRQLLPYCDTAYVTKFKKSFEKDVTIPNLDESPEWVCVSESEEYESCGDTDSESGLHYIFTKYVRQADEKPARTDE